MKASTAYIFLLVFSGFLVSISVNYSGFLKLINAGDPVESITTIPEESEESDSADDLKHSFHLHSEPFTQGGTLLPLSSLAYLRNHFSKYIPEVPYSPPELA